MLVLAAEALVDALVGAGGAVAAALIAVAGTRLRVSRRRALFDKREQAATEWSKWLSVVTARLGTIPTGRDHRAVARAQLGEARGAIDELQRTGQGELADAFGRDSALVCAERHIRALSKAAVDIGYRAVSARNSEEADAHWERLSCLNSSGIDMARWAVFDAEFKAWKEEPKRDLRKAASPEASRRALRRLIEEHCDDRIDCDLVGASPSPGR